MANVDIYMDEQTSLNVSVNTSYPDGSPLDLTNGTVTWVADFNGEQKIKKDTSMMSVMLAPVPSSTITETAAAGQRDIVLANIESFSDPWGRHVDNFALGQILNIKDQFGHAEVNIIQSMDIPNKTLTMVNPLANEYTEAHTTLVAQIITAFNFSILPGDTILPATKTYGTPIIWQHMAQVTYPVGLSPVNIYQVPTTMIVLRGRMFINPVLGIDP